MPNEIEMDQIASSSNIKAIGYDPVAQICKVEFVSKPGTFYEYIGVSQDDYDAIRNAPSIGSAVNKHLVRGVYGSRKL